MRASEPALRPGAGAGTTAGEGTAHGSAPTVVALDDRRAVDPGLTGAKAANLATALVAGLPGLGGFVLTTAATGQVRSTDDLEVAAGPELRRQWERWSGDGARPLVVRSSSVGEDTEGSSMAGQFTSVLDVEGWRAFCDAVLEVIASAERVARIHGPAGEGAGDPRRARDGAPAGDDGPGRVAGSPAGGGSPADEPGVVAHPDIAVLVQPQVEAAVGGVAFGIDPLTGDRHHLLASAVAGSPDLIVKGAVTGTSLVLSRRGRLLEARGEVPAGLDRRRLRELAGLVGDARRVFGSPQDIEWLVDPDGRLVLLQSRPVTASAVPAERSHPLGPGPVAETFPEPLSRLERDLWLPPLDDGIAGALRLSGAGGRRQRYVVDVHGRVAVDLQVLGAIGGPTSVWRLLDPRPGARRLRAAWRLGRLRPALAGIAEDLVVETDAHLRAVPPLGTLDDHQLLTLLRTSRKALAALHAHEVVAGLLVAPDAVATTGAAMATATLRRDRLDGLDDAEIVARHPVVLALLPPRVGPLPALPPTPDVDPGSPAADVRVADVPVEDPMAVAREALRLRVRWVQELAARAAHALGVRLAARGQLPSADAVRDLGLDELTDLVAHPEHRIAAPDHEDAGPPLPAVFRLSAGGDVVADLQAGDGPQGASAGRARGRITHDAARADGRVLVVRHLDPSLAPLLDSVVALVAETGSPLSHLAILAREHRVPTVVGVVDASTALVEGEEVVVDGAAGTVERAAVEQGEAAGGTEVVDVSEVVDGTEVVDVSEEGSP